MIAALAVAASFARPAWAESDFLTNLHKAESRKDPAEKVEYLNRAIEAWEPIDGNELLSSAHLQRGEASYWLYDFARAEPDLSKAVELDPGSAQAYLLRGRILLKQGKFTEAAVEFREYAGLKSEDIEGWLALGEAQTRGGQLGPALQTYKRVEQIDPTDWRLPLGRARQAMMRKNWSEAIGLLSAADAAAKGRAPEVLADRAVCRVALGHGEAALKDYDAAIALYNKAADKVVRSRGLKLTAAETLTKAARTYFGRGRVNEFLARATEAADDYAEACRLGNPQGCAKTKVFGAQPPTPKPEPKQDSGDRIYAN